MQELHPPTTATANVSRFTVFFFKGSLLHVRLLQLLVGGRWESPSHVIYALDDLSYEITEGGLVVGGRGTQALYRECLDAYTFCLTPAQAFVLRQYFSSLTLKFNVWSCVRYCWRLLTEGVGSYMSYWDALDFGQVVRVQPYETCYCPPFSCTTPMWEALGEQEAAWNAFAPSALYDSLTGATLDFVEDTLEQ